MFKAVAAKLVTSFLLALSSACADAVEGGTGLRTRALAIKLTRLLRY